MADGDSLTRHSGEGGGGSGDGGGEKRCRAFADGATAAAAEEMDDNLLLLLDGLSPSPAKKVSVQTNSGRLPYAESPGEG